MLKRILLSGAALSALATFAVAQTAPADPPASPAPPAAQTPMSPAPGADSATVAETADPNLYSNIQGADIVGDQDETVGRVADLLLDSGGQLRQIVIGHGGIVGIGETLRIYDVSELPKVENGKVAMNQMTTASIEGLPEYAYPKAETGRASTDGSASPPAAPAPVQASDQWPASYLVGANITNAQESAEINDLRFEGNKVAAVLIDKGALGLGTDVAEVPFADLAISGTPTEPQIALKASNPGLAVEGGAADAPATSPAPAPAAPEPAPAPAPAQ